MSDGAILSGQQYDPSRGTVQRFTEQVKDYDKDASPRVTGDEGYPATEINPLDGAAAKVRVYTPIDPGDLNDTLSHKWLDYIRVQFPDVLLGIDPYFNVTRGEGTYDETGKARAAGQSISLSQSLQATGQASITIVPSIVPQIQQIWANEVAATHIVTFMALASVGNAATVLTELSAAYGSTVTAWPVFKPETHVFTLHGKQVDIQARANVQQNGNRSNDGDYAWSYSEGSGQSYTTGGSVTREVIAQVLHGTITITPHTSSQTIQAEATVSIDGDGSKADLPGEAGTGFTTWADLTADGTLETEDIIASITPSSLSPTSPAAIPISGVKLKSLEVSTFSDGVVLVHAIVVDFAQFA